jgi:hypothetical protein
MTRLHVHKKTHDDDTTEFLSPTTVQVPLQRVIDERMTSWVSQALNAHRRRGMPPWAGQIWPQPEGAARLKRGWFEFEFEGPMGRGRQEGMLRVRDVAEFPKWILRNHRPVRGTALYRYLRSMGAAPADGKWDARSEAAVRRIPQVVDLSMGTSLIPGFPGVYVTGDDGCEEMRLLEVPGPQPVYAPNASPTIEITVERRVGGGNYRIPVVQRLRFGPGGEWTCHDGRDFLYGESLADLPPRLEALMNSKGTAWEPTAVRMRPSADLTPMFLLRCPSMADVARTRGDVIAPPAVAARPALLYPTTDPLPLLDAGGDLLGLPIVDAPEAALAILARCPARGVYVPSSPPLDPRDVHRSGARWLAGVSCAGASA